MAMPKRLAFADTLEPHAKERRRGQGSGSKTGQTPHLNKGTFRRFSHERFSQGSGRLSPLAQSHFPEGLLRGFPRRPELREGIRTRPQALEHDPATAS